MIGPKKRVFSIFKYDWLGFKLSDFIGCCGCYTPWVNRNRFSVTTVHREERAAQVCFFSCLPVLAVVIFAFCVVLRGCACIRAYACGFHAIVVVIVICCC